MACLFPKWTSTWSPAPHWPGQGRRAMCLFCVCPNCMLGETVLRDTVDTASQELQCNFLCYWGEGKNAKCAFQLQEIPPPNCCTCQATGIASMNKRNPLFGVIALACLYFSSVLSSPFSHLLREECYLKLCEFSTTDIFFTRENGSFLSQERQLLCSQKN